MWTFDQCNPSLKAWTLQSCNLHIQGGTFHHNLRIGKTSRKPPQVHRAYGG